MAETDQMAWTPLAKAVLEEVRQAYAALQEHGQGHTLFLDKIPLTAEERQAISDFLGQGKLTIKLEDALEPVQWRETAFSGIWQGVYCNLQDTPVLETLEIAWYPELASAQREDVDKDSRRFNTWFNEQGSPA
nr:hydrogenase expression/formation C-terminal domain-containing protein [uncultured Anaeromusa sp.]